MFNSCEILKSRKEVDKATSILCKMGLMCNSACGCKDWDMAHVLPQLANGNILDMGCQGSLVLSNTILMGIVGEKIGIDLVALPQQFGFKTIQGDLTCTGLPSEHFDYITCLSVVEHGVDTKKFAKECGRLLRRNGRLFLTFDYWDPKTCTSMALFGQPWNILCRIEVESLIQEMEAYGISIVSPMIWTQEEKVIYPGYHSPNNSAYTFGAIEMMKSI